MARYYKPNYMPLQDLTPKVPVEAYYNLMNQVAQNRANAETAAAKVKEDMYGIKYMDNVAHDYAVGNAEKLILESLNADFPTQATMANTLGRASQYIQPFKQLSELQVDKARQAELLKIQNPDILINDPANMKIFNPQSKSWANPKDIKLDAINPDVMRKIVDASEAGFLTSTREKAVKSDISFYHKILSITGKDDEEKVLHYGDNGDRIGAIRDMINKEVPNIQRFFNNDPKQAEAYLNNLVRNVVGKYAYKEDTKYLENKAAWYKWQKAQETPPPSSIPAFLPTSGQPIKSDISAAYLLDDLTGAKRGTTKSLPTVAFNADGSMKNISTRGTKDFSYTSTPGGLVGTTTYNEFNKDAFLYHKRLWQIKNRNPSMAKWTDKQVNDWLLKQGETLGSSYYNNSGLSLGDDIVPLGGNAFVDDDGNIKDGAPDIKVRNSKTGKWELVPLENLAETLGYDEENQNDFIKDLSGLSSKDFEFYDGEVMNTGVLKDAKGNIAHVKYKPFNLKTSAVLEPALRVHEALTTSGTHKIVLNGLVMDVNNEPKVGNDLNMQSYVSVSNVDLAYQPRNKQEAEYIQQFYDMLMQANYEGNIAGFLTEASYESAVNHGVNEKVFNIKRNPNNKTTIEQ